MEHTLECQTCGETYPPGVRPIACPACDRDGRVGRLEVALDLDSIDPATLPFDEAGGAPDRVSSMWRYRSLLPLLGEAPVTAGEGWTPLSESPRLAAAAGDGSAEVEVLVKNETTNPTWSFKDRLNSLLLSNLAAEGVDRVATSSTGNHGASTAAYARRAGIDDVIVLLHPNSEDPCRLQVRAYGAESVVTDADARGRLLAELVDRGWYPTTSVGGRHHSIPYGPEGYKTIGLEIAEQLPEPPDAVLVPTGSGDGLYGIWKGFRELRDLGVLDSTPRMVAVQPDALAPMVRAVEAGTADVEIESSTPPLTTSTASDTVDAHALTAIQDSDGAAYGVSREAIAEALRATAGDGVLLEPASALAPAGVAPAVEDGLVEAGDTVVCVGTGAGVKWPDSLRSLVGEVPTISPDMESLAASVSVPLDDRS